MTSEQETAMYDQPEPTDDERAFAWAEYRKDYEPNPAHFIREAVAFQAGWDAHARRCTVQGDVPQVLAWIDKTLKLPVYQEPFSEIAEGVVATLRTVRKMLDGTSRPDASWRTVQGEPSDAAVLAALNARELSVRERSGSARHFNPAPDLSYYGEGNIADMRATLRAAAAVQGGETR